MAAPKRFLAPCRAPGSEADALAARSVTPMTANHTGSQHHTGRYIAMNAPMPKMTNGASTSPCWPYAVKYVVSTDFSALVSCVASARYCCDSNSSGSGGSGADPGVHPGPFAKISISSLASTIAWSSSHELSPPAFSTMSRQSDPPMCPPARIMASTPRPPLVAARRNLRRAPGVASSSCIAVDLAMSLRRAGKRWVTAWKRVTTSGMVGFLAGAFPWPCP